MRCHFICSS